MKRLIIYHAYFAPAFKAGGPVRSLVNLSDQLQQDLNIIVVCSGMDLDGTRLRVKSGIPVQFQDNAYQVVYAPSLKTMRSLRDEETISYINGLYSFRYNVIPLLFAKGKRILSVRGMLSKEALEKKRFKKSVFLVLLRFLLFLRPVHFHVTSEQESIDIQRAFGKNVRFTLIPNLSSSNNEAKPVIKQSGKLVLTSIALISAMKNHLLVLKALSEVTYPVEYNIWGPVMDKEYWDLCKLEITKLSSSVRVFYHGSCDPADVQQKIADADVMIQPSESENFGHSLVEALSAGCPIITSKTTPWGELEENQAGINVDLNIDSIKKAIAFFAEMDNEDYQLWRTGAKSYIAQRLQLEENREKYIKLFTQ